MLRVLSHPPLSPSLPPTVSGGISLTPPDCFRGYLPHPLTVSGGISLTPPTVSGGISVTPRLFQGASPSLPLTVSGGIVHCSDFHHALVVLNDIGKQMVPMRFILPISGAISRPPIHVSCIPMSLSPVSSASKSHRSH